tara:strand:+ start:554 stop:766 length:213 start_codon:yes stop_codon:yes gene_type:complete
MDKDKLIKAGMWLSATFVTIGIDAILFFTGFKLEREGKYLLLIVAFCLLPFLFFCAYKGMKYLLESIFTS